MFGGSRSRNRGSPSLVSVDAVVGGYPGPALRLTANGRIADRNAPAEALTRHEGDRWMQGLFAWLASPEGPAQATHHSLVPDDDGAKWIEWTPVSLPDNTVVVFGRDITVEHSLRQALVDSRHRFRDFAELSCDFAWETDDRGVFTYLSDPCPLGYEPGRLIGTAAHDLIADGNLARSPFEARRTVRNADVTLVDRRGTTRRFSVHARPMTDADGRWQGARGVCHRSNADP